MMSPATTLDWIALGAAVIFVLMLINALANMVYLRRQRRISTSGTLPSVAVLVPARNEERNIGRLVDSVLAQEYPGVTLHVFDDQSEDLTPDILASYDDVRLRVMHGDGPPPGWMGKVHALYQLTRGVEEDVFLFLDADTELTDPKALTRMVNRFQGMELDVGTGVTGLKGGGTLLVSLVGSIILSAMPWWVGKRIPASSMAGVNGQCWMVRAPVYRTFEPHDHVRGQVLEDIHIGRYLHRQGIRPALMDVQHDVLVHMYANLEEAWSGFRKNAYDIAGGSPLRLVVGLTVYVTGLLVLPVLYPVLLLPLFGIKWATDRFLGVPLRITLAAPVSWVLGAAVLMHSTWANWTGTNEWKGRILTRQSG
jgi:glycosyltransferase involved in cell wall biosynthesis